MAKDLHDEIRTYFNSNDEFAKVAMIYNTFMTHIKNGTKIQLDTRKKIIHALNVKRSENALRPLNLTDLEQLIRGEFNE